MMSATQQTLGQPQMNEIIWETGLPVQNRLGSDHFVYVWFKTEVCPQVLVWKVNTAQLHQELVISGCSVLSGYTEQSPFWLILAL